MAAEGLAARAAAVGLLGAVLGEGRLMAQVVADHAGPLTGLTPADRARAQRLALAVLRHLEPADRVLEPHLRKAPPGWFVMRCGWRWWKSSRAARRMAS